MFTSKLATSSQDSSASNQQPSYTAGPHHGEHAPLFREVWGSEPRITDPGTQLSGFRQLCHFLLCELKVVSSPLSTCICACKLATVAVCLAEMP